MKVSQRLSELQTQTVGSTLGWLQFTKGHNAVKTVDLYKSDEDQGHTSRSIEQMVLRHCFYIYAYISK